MNMAERAGWVQRGFKDPVEAFREHIGSARKRGIPFRMTFEQWWELWEPHYERRGMGAGCFVMCRTKDDGPYAVGNARIDTVRANVEERFALYRAAQSGSGRTPAEERCANPVAAAWVFDRGAWGMDYCRLRKLSEQDEEYFSEIVDSE